METWLLFAIVSVFIVGLYNFGMKIIAKRNYNTSFVTIISYTSAAISSGLYYFYTHGDNILIESLLLVLLFAFLHRGTMFLSVLARVQALHHIDTTIFFPIYKMLFPIGMTMLSVFYFNENLSLYESIGILIGIMIPLLLITKNEKSIQSNLKKGLYFILLTTITSGAASLISKMLIVRNLDVDFFIFIGLVFGIFVASFNYHLGKKSSKKQYSTKGVYGFGIILGIITFLGFYTYTHSLEGNLAIAVTINSFSILIPIILSVIFYKEEMTFKKAFVVFLSIVSVILFI